MEPTLNIISLKKSEEDKLNEIFNYYARAESKSWKFNEFVWFLLEKNIVSNRNSLSEFRELFEKASAPETTMSRQRFTYAISMLAQKLFQNEKTPIERMFQEVLTERTIINKDVVEPLKIPAYDEPNKKVIQEGCLSVLIDYEKELQRIYTLYVSENIKYGKMMLTWKEVAIQGKKMSTYCFIRFLKEADVVPNMVGIEQIEDIMIRILPPIATKEFSFYNTNVIVQIYEKDLQGGQEVKHDGDPRFLFHEFQLALARVGLDALSRQSEKKDDELTLRKFFSQYLMIRTNDELSKKDVPQINRPFLKRLNASYLPEIKQKRKQDGKEDEKVSNYGENLVDKLLNQPPVELSFKDVFKQLDKELPPYPDEIKTEPQNLAPTQADKKIIGKPMPKPPPDKNAAKKNQTKSSRNKKEDELPPSNWAGMPQPKPKTDYQHLDTYKDIKEEEDELEELNSGVMSDIEVAPELIRENLYPNDLPDGIDTYIEAYLVSHNTSNFPFALQNLARAKAEWEKKLLPIDLPEEHNLFFEYSAGLVYESANRDDYALSHFIACKSICDKLPVDSPDRALPYCGMGAILYKTHDYKWALRCFLMAREIREATLGSDTVDTASVYNNLGCCMYFLGRSHESLAYFKLAYAIIELELGPFHYRTATIKRNISKCNKAEFQTVAPFKTPWATYQLDQFPAKKKKAAAKKAAK